MNSPADKSLVIIPTYNEIENIDSIISRLRHAEPDVDVLIVDDNSPDGTGDKADELAANDDRIHVLHREEKTGLLGAYKAGFHYGLDNGYDVLIEMDADGSHAPEELGKLLAEIEKGADMVIGSRYIEGGEVVNWPAQRYALSKGGNLYIGLLLGTGLTDMTAGYRAIRREVFDAVNVEELSTKGYIFQVDFAFRAIEAELDVREVPITFTERVHGESKLDGSFVADSLQEVTRWGIAHRGAQAKELASELSRVGKYEFQKSQGPKILKKLKTWAGLAPELAKELKAVAEFEASRKAK